MVYRTVHDMQRLRWQCRRGMLELDYLLEAFLDLKFNQLSGNEQNLFVDLLENSDPILQGWLLGQEKPDNEMLENLIDKIKETRI